MIVIIMRHGNAETRDNDRHLSVRGEMEVSKVASYLVNKYKITKTISSPKTRAKETLDIILKTINDEHLRHEIMFELSDDSEDSAMILDYVEASTIDSDVVLLVSHIPVVNSLAYEFIRNDVNSYFSFSTANALVLEKENDKYKVLEFIDIK